MTEDGGGIVHQFQWNQQGSRVLEQLKALYDHSEGAGAVLGLQPDVVLVSSDGGCVEAHRMVLSLCSAYFQELFVKVSQVTNPKMKDGPAVVVLGNVKTCQLQQLLQFLYTGEVTVSSDQLEEFVEMGNVFQIEEIISFKSSTVNLSVTQNDSSLTLNAGDAKTNALVGVSEDDKESLEASSSTPILYEDVSDEDMDINYDIYPVKLEGESEASLDPLGDSSTDHHDEDPTWSAEENQDSSAGEEDDKEEYDPTYEEKLRKVKRRRRTPRLGGAPAKSRPITKVDWEIQDPVSDEILQLKWRIYQKQYRVSGSATTYYYCAAGGQHCPVKLKKKVLNDGTVVWFHNHATHNFHPGADSARQKQPQQCKPKRINLTPEQSQFVLQCLEGGVTSLNDILLKFKVQDLTPPDELHLRAFLRDHQQTKN